MKAHKLKITPLYYNDVTSGIKSFELRKDDRDFGVGDMLILEEYDADQGGYTGRYVVRYVGYVLKNCEEFGLSKDYCILGLIDECIYAGTEVNLLNTR